jgi:hypothetical protein
LQGLPDRLETKLQKVWHPVVDNDDGEDHGESIRELRLFLGPREKLIHLHLSIYGRYSAGLKLNLYYVSFV